MPIYDVKCTECGTVYEVFVHKREHIESLTCKECGAPVKPKIGPSVPIFKGSGFYETDYKKKK